MKSFGPERIEAAARRGNDIRATTYGSIKSILQNGLDRAFAKPNTPDASPIRQLRTDAPRKQGWRESVAITNV